MEYHNLESLKHINANEADIVGNRGVGRYVLLPSFDESAASLAENFKKLDIRAHPRSHNLYLGEIDCHGHSIEVAAISSGMGGASLDVIVNELFLLGARRFIRLGRAESQPSKSHLHGEILVPTGCVRGESASRGYLPKEFPAIPSFPFLLAAHRARLSFLKDITAHFAVVHSNDSLYARRYLKTPMEKEADRYHSLLNDSGVYGSDMESSHLMILGSILNQKLMSDQGKDVCVGSILTINDEASQSITEKEAIKRMTPFLFQTLYELDYSRLDV